MAQVSHVLNVLGFAQITFYYLIYFYAGNIKHILAALQYVGVSICCEFYSSVNASVNNCHSVGV